jgi:hypothetical protein
MYCRQTRNIRPVLFQTANCDVQSLCDGTRHRCPELWATQKWFLLHDNVQPYTLLSVRELLSVHQIAEFPRATFSRFVTLRFFLIPMTEQTLKGQHYNDEWSFKRRDRTALQHSSKCFAGLLQRPREMLVAV